MRGLPLVLNSLFCGSSELGEGPLGSGVACCGTLVEPLLGLCLVLCGAHSVQVAASDDEHGIGVVVLGCAEVGLEGRLLGLDIDGLSGDPLDDLPGDDMSLLGCAGVPHECLLLVGLCSDTIGEAVTGVVLAQD